VRTAAFIRGDPFLRPHVRLSMPPHSQRTTPPAIDERWLDEWVTFGMRQLADYLARHAAFDAYCRRRENAPGS